MHFSIYKTSLTTILGIGICLASVQPASAVVYRVDELPPAPGYAYSNASQINDAGDVVGSSSPATGGFKSVGTLWRGVTPINLGKADKGNYSDATAINNFGKVGGEADNGDFRPNVVAFQRGAAKFIDKGANNSHVAAVIDNGSFIGNYLKGFGGTWLPTLWTEDPRKPGEYRHLFLPMYQDPTGASSYNYISDANNSGAAVGQVSGVSLGGDRPGFWNNDVAHTLSVLPLLSNDWGGYAYAINDTGTIVGVSNQGISRSTPVVWEASSDHAITALPLLPGEVQGTAAKINNAGQIVGFHGDGSAPAVWINGQIFDLQSSLDQSGAGWQLLVVSDINNSGEIVGTGQLNGQTRAFVLTPVE